MADANSPLFRFQVWRAALPPALRVLLTANVATYVAFVTLSIFGLGEWLLWGALPAGPEGVLTRPWTVLTWGVTNLYPGFFGLLSFVFGVLWLNWLGRDYEETYTSAALFALYVVGTLAGAALALGAGALLGAGGIGGVYFGVWGPLLAVLCAVATLSPNRPVGLLFLGEVPLKWVAIAFVVLELAFSKDPSHLGAALGGFLFATAQKRGLDPAVWARPLFRDRRAQRARTTARPTARTVPTPTRAAAGRSAPAAPARAPAPDVDKILDKILDQGVESLTEEERRILNRAGRG